MTDALLHERLYRGSYALEKLARARVVLCGMGALGSHLADNLVRQGVRHLCAIDRDRVAAHNVGTQLYDEGDVGGFKADVLRVRLFRAMGVEIEAVAKELGERNVATLLRGADLVVDAFDNAAGRGLVTAHCRATGLPCLHLGMNADYGEVRWNETYRVPADVLAPDVCAYPLARNLILIVVALGSETALRFLLAGAREDYSFTLRDLAINHESD
jgi:molybdopterin/thiamine biosynthesis adenylyltransferase